LGGKEAPFRIKGEERGIGKGGGREVKTRKGPRQVPIDHGRRLNSGEKAQKKDTTKVPKVRWGKRLEEREKERRSKSQDEKFGARSDKLHIKIPHQRRKRVDKGCKTV